MTNKINKGALQQFVTLYHFVDTKKKKKKKRNAHVDVRLLDAEIDEYLSHAVTFVLVLGF